MNRRALSALALTLLVAAGPAAAAGAIYKYTDASGRMVYTDDPRGARNAERVDDSLLSVVPAPGATARDTAGRQLVEAANRRAQGLDRAQSDMVSASRALEQAEEARQLGIEPLEGERIGRRFRDEYWQRQAGLELQIQTARAQLDNAIARRNDLR